LEIVAAGAIVELDRIGGAGPGRSGRQRNRSNGQRYNSNSEDTGESSTPGTETIGFPCAHIHLVPIQVVSQSWGSPLHISSGR
jgi:hypothetical protein